jgi:RNA polymerase sigma-70 factor (ECF subfamily)
VKGGLLTSDHGPIPPHTRPTSFASFYQACYPRVFRTAYALLGSVSEAEHVAQETFTRALARWDRISRYDNPTAWLHRVCIRLADRESRRARRFVPIDEKYEGASRSPFSDPDLIGAIRALPRRQRAATVLYYLMGHSTSDIAFIFRCKESTVRVTLHNARAALRSQLQIDEDAGGMR